MKQKIPVVDENDLKQYRLQSRKTIGHILGIYTRHGPLTKQDAD